MSSIPNLVEVRRTIPAHLQSAATTVARMPTFKCLDGPLTLLEDLLKDKLAGVVNFGATHLDNGRGFVQIETGGFSIVHDPRRIDTSIDRIAFILCSASKIALGQIGPNSRTLIEPTHRVLSPWKAISEMRTRGAAKRPLAEALRSGHPHKFVILSFGEIIDHIGPSF